MELGEMVRVQSPGGQGMREGEGVWGLLPYTPTAASGSSTQWALEVLMAMQALLPGSPKLQLVPGAAHGSKKQSQAGLPLSCGAP